MINNLLEAYREDQSMGKKNRNKAQAASKNKPINPDLININIYKSF